MSLLDFILEQKLVLASIGMVVVPMLLALALWFVAKIRATSARRARQKALAQQQQAAEAAMARPTEEQPSEAAVQPRPVQVAAPSAPARSVLPQANPAQPAQAASSTDESKTAEPQGNAVSTAMQDLLSSVFSDEEKSARYAVLLAGLDPVRASDLAALSNRVADGLRARPHAAIEGKEYTR